VKNNYGTEKEAWALNGLEELLKKKRICVDHKYGTGGDDPFGCWQLLYIRYLEY
jgi:hypothetical protein